MSDSWAWVANVWQKRRKARALIDIATEAGSLRRTGEAKIFWFMKLSKFV
jgi:hypothetical protein